jgi:hypothetical protein
MRNSHPRDGVSHRLDLAGDPGNIFRRKLLLHR